MTIPINLFERSLDVGEAQVSAGNRVAAVI